MSTVTRTTVRNGVDVDQMHTTLDAVGARPELGRFQFRATNQWINGAHSRSTIRSFYGVGAEDISRRETFALDAGQPEILLGGDTGPSPAEYLLHALAASLTASIVYTAAAREINLTEVSSTLVGDMDLRGTLGLAGEVRNGFRHIGIAFTVRGDVPEEQLREVVAHAQQRSAVLDVITNGAPVSVEVTTP